jgi:ubiquinone/menaquinone biosynthesis C-methylase UbiE
VLARHGHEVIGIDLDGEMLRWARKKNQVNLDLSFVRGDATNLGFSDGTFDVVTISFAMHDVPREIGSKILAEVKRVLVPDGKVVIIDYNEPARNLIAKLVCLIALLYESPNFKEFVKVGVVKYLSEAGLVLIDRFTILGAVQVVSCR